MFFLVFSVLQNTPRQYHAQQSTYFPIYRRNFIIRHACRENIVEEQFDNEYVSDSNYGDCQLAGAYVE